MFDSRDDAGVRGTRGAAEDRSAKRKRFFSDVRGGCFRPSRPLPGKARSRSDRGAPAGHRAESRPEIRLVGTVTGRRSDVPRALAGKHEHRETQGRFSLPIDDPSSAGPVSSQPGGYRAATCGDTGPAPHDSFLDMPAFPQLGDGPEKSPRIRVDARAGGAMSRRQ